MSENKFIKHLKGEDTAKSVLEIKNQNTPTSFANMPVGTSNANDVYSDPRGDAVGVLKGSDNWKLDGQNLIKATTVYGDGRDLTTTYQANGATPWVDSTYTFSSAKRFNPNTKFVLKLCGERLSNTEDTVPFSLIITIGNSIITKSFVIKEHAFAFSEEFVIDFAESNASAIKAAANSTMRVQLLCGDATASAVIYNGMTVFTALQRRVDADAVSTDTRSVEEMETDLDGKVNIDGSSIMTAPLKFMAGSMRGAVGPYLNGVGFWKLDSQANLTLVATLSDSQFLPATTGATTLGNSTKKWKDLYLSGTAYISTINNKHDIFVPDYGGTMVVADFNKVSEGMFLRLDKDLHPIWETVTLTTSLSSLTDVTITSATSGQVLTYDGSKWVNQAIPTPTINYSINGGNYTAGTGVYAITRFSLMLQKADGTWEKPTDTSANYSQATNKTVNTNGFLLNQILYYNNTTGVSGGQLTGLNKVYSKHATVPMSYSTNCGTAPGWALGTWVYLVGTLGADGLFYLDTTQWWSDALPNTNDGKLYIRLGPASSSTSDTVALLEDRPIFYHDGTRVREFNQGGSVDIDGTTITLNNNNEIQAIAVIDQNTGIVKTWTGTAAEYDAIVTKDPDTEYIITDDIGGAAVEIGQITETLNDKVDKGHEVIEFQAPTADNGYTWYRKYADGWVEQGGIITETSTVAQKSIVFPVEMADANYNLQVTLVTDTNSNNPTYYAVGARTKSATGFTCYAAANFTKDWKACGMAAV